MKRRIVRIALVLSLAVIAVVASGCAQVMVVRQPSPFSPTTLEVGERRSVISGEIGPPVATETGENRLTDTYNYVDGGPKNHWASKIARVLMYTAGDFFTLFLTQVVWLPMESMGFKGTTHSVVVDYENGGDYWRAEKIENNEVHGN